MAPQSSRAAVPAITLSELASIYTQSALAVQFAAKVIALNLFVGSVAGVLSEKS
jgi:hypothetical protein